MKIEEYETWVNQALPGDRLVYHIGHLAPDRGRYGPKMEWLPEPLDALASLIYGDMERGLVELTQSQFLEWGQGGTGPAHRKFVYRATRTSKEL